MRLLLILLLISAAGNLSAQYALKIVDSLSREPLSFATISDTTTNFSDYADAAGRLTVPRRVRRAVISYVGYNPVNINFSEAQQVFTVALSPKLSLPIIEVRSNNATADYNPSVHIVPMERLKDNPALLGEMDPLKALSILPGVSNGVEGTAGIIIRGGNANQTAIMIDGQQVYNVNHVGGFLSAIPEYGVQFVQLYKGGVPSRYGGRLSGVVDLILKNGRKDRAAYQLGIGAALLRGGAEGPLSKKITYLVSGRLGYPTLLNDLFSSPFYERGESGSHTTVRIYDVLGKLTFTDNDWTVSLNTFVSGDFGFDQFDGGSQFFNQNFNWANSLVGLKINKQVNAALSVESGVGLSRYRYAYDQLDRRFTIDSSFEQSNIVGDLMIQDLRGFLRADYVTNFNVSLEAGLEYTSRQLNQDFSFVEQGTAPLTSSLTEPNSERIAYVSGNWTHPDGAGQISAGLRLTNYRSGNFSVWRPEPRINASLRLFPKLFLHGGYDVQSQFVHELITSLNILPNSVWISASQLTPPARSEQFSLGLAGTLGKRNINWSAEVFTKSLGGMIRIQPGFERDVEAGLADNTEAIANDGTGSVRGLELSLKGDFRRFRYQLAYTLLKSTRQYPTINGGEEFPFTFDRRNDLSALLTYQTKGKWSFASQFTYQSGYAVTLPVATSFFFDVYDGFNNARFPPFHLLNLSAKRTWVGKKTDNRHELSISVYNVYNRANSFFGSRFRETVQITNPDTMETEFAVRSRLNTRRLLGVTPGISYTRYIGN